ncbi:hypothetical protein AKJ28_02795 [Corynebacterium glutamicum]|nr:hypothetical protein AKJ22_03140 [Corynebacterium glutamicum]TWS57525.1 hypothetical protein AKJ28_02795 [Corynebacterium glutamicum]
MTASHSAKQKGLTTKSNLFLHHRASWVQKSTTNGTLPPFCGGYSHILSPAGYSWVSKQSNRELPPRDPN